MRVHNYTLVSDFEKAISNNDVFINSPKRTKPFPFTKKVRKIANRHPTLIASIPHGICQNK
jgi:hypothetical protein